MFQLPVAARSDHRCEYFGDLIRIKEEIKREREIVAHNQHFFKLFVFTVESLWGQFEDKDIKRNQLIEAISTFIEKQFQLSGNRFVRLFNQIEGYFKLIEIKQDANISTMSQIIERDEIKQQRQALNSSKLKRQDAKSLQILDKSINKQSIKNKQTPKDLLLSRKSSKNLLEKGQIIKLAQHPSFIKQQILKIKSSPTLVWSPNRAFVISNNRITMQLSGWYKLRTNNPIYKSGKHFLKFQLQNLVTVSFGLAVEENKSGKFINDKLNGTISYISFSNGGGMVKNDGQIIASGLMNHISPGTNLQMTIDFNKYELTFKNSRSEPLLISMGRKFPSSPIYLFLHMKDTGTVIDVLQYSIYQ